MSGHSPISRGSRCRIPEVVGLACLACFVWAGLTLFMGPEARADAAEAALKADAPQPEADAANEGRIMPLDEVRRGMTGYGLTVFHGTEPEPFKIEVLSIAHHFGPQRSVIWAHSDDPRMLESGPVQGMSGSPIYIWDENEDGEPGEGGRLVGAFAYGFAMAKGCIIGIQPIEYMLDVGQRAHDEGQGAPQGAATGGGADVMAADADRTAPGGHVATAKRSLAQLARMAERHRSDDHELAPRLEAMGALLDPSRLNQHQPGQPASPDQPIEVGTVAAWPTAAGERASLPAAPHGHEDQGQVVPMMLPMSVGSSELAELARPLLEPLGITPVGGGGGGGGVLALAGGIAPHGVDRDAVDFVPGGVISVPLAFGDLDLAASGTVTDVLEDGTVLGLGHAMFGEGVAALPMATGHVHFIVPRVDLSFKLSGSLDIRGTLVRDEVVGVAGRTDVERFRTASMNVNVTMPGHEARRFSYQVVDHHQLTPMIATIVALQSITAAHQPPPESTLSLRGEIRFSGDYPPLKLDTMMPGEQMFGVMSELMPPLALAMQNPHEGLKLESIDLTAEITPQRRTATIINAQLDRAEVAPGERVGVTIWVQPYKQRPQRIRTELEIPAHVPEGDYPLVISDAGTYLRQLMSLRPHLFTTRNVDELMQMIRRIMSVEANTIHLTMHLPEEGIAVGRQELSRLPSSQRAMIFTPTSTIARPFMEMLEHKLETDLGITGQSSFTVHVRNNHTRVQPANER